MDDWPIAELVGYVEQCLAAYPAPDSGRVRAVPEDGKANEALIALLAKTLAVPKSHLRIVSGATSRLKRIAIAGQNPTVIAARLEVL